MTISQRIDAVLLDAHEVVAKMRLCIELLERIRAEEDADFSNDDLLDIRIAGNRSDEVVGIGEELTESLKQIHADIVFAQRRNKTQTGAFNVSK